MNGAFGTHPKFSRSGRYIQKRGMNYEHKTFYPSCYCVFLLVSVTGCAGKTLPPKLGHYIGEKSNWGVYFDVAAAGVEHFGIVFVTNSTNGGVHLQQSCTIGPLPTMPINVDGTFSIIVGQNQDTTISGKISDGSVSGEYTTTTCGAGKMQGKWSASFSQPVNFDAAHAATVLESLGFKRNPALDTNYAGVNDQWYVYGTDNGALSDSYMTVDIDDYGHVTFSEWTAVYLKGDNKKLFDSAVTQIYTPAVGKWVDSTVTEILGPTGQAVDQSSPKTIDGYQVFLGVDLHVSVAIWPPDHK